MERFAVGSGGELYLYAAGHVAAAWLVRAVVDRCCRFWAGTCAGSRAGLEDVRSIL